MNLNQITTLLLIGDDTIIANSKQRDEVIPISASFGSFTLVEKSLQVLSREFEIVFVSQSRGSVVEEVEKNLERQRLLPFFNHLFTLRDFNMDQVQPEFFTAIQKYLKLSPENIVVCGKDYQEAALTPKLTGLKAIWLNPARLPAPGLFPQQDGEVNNIQQLLSILKKPFLPDMQTCITWYTELGVTHNLLAHVTNVAAIAYQIALWMEEKGQALNPLLTHRGGITHDLAKLQPQNEKNHADLAAEFLEQKGQLELAEIARRHLIGDLADEETRPLTWEQKIVNYADKLSEGSQLVSLDERLTALQNRYPDFAQKIRTNIPLIKGLEVEILSVLSISPETLNAKLKKALNNKSIY